MTKSGTSRTSKPCFKIQDLETLRVISDPLRTKIFEMLIDEPLTIRQLAERLGLATSRLYYQVNMMERAKFIRVTETRRVANLEEKVYQSVAPCIELAPGLLDFAKSGDMEISIRLLTGALDATREDLVRSLEARQMILEQGAEPHLRPVTIGREIGELSDEELQEFKSRLDALVNEFKKHEKTTASGKQPYSLTIVFYPIFYFPEDETPKK